MKHLVTSLLFMSISQLLIAQSNFKIQKVNDYFFKSEIDILDTSLLYLDSLPNFTSFKIECVNPILGTIHVLNSDSVLMDLKQESCDLNTSGNFTTHLVVFSKSRKNLSLKFSKAIGKIAIQFFFAPPLDNTLATKLNKATNPCDKPIMVSYTVWRKGLPDPKPNREQTITSHLVIHHSAGSNTDTNYLNTVRNIYLLHTQSNGWDDIGYNFLIAPNGIVFNGRDPQGVADDDQILGAHFCAKNQNTMGTCLLGNFENTKPTEQAIFSLEYLLAWKLKKERLNGLGSSMHPKTNGSELKTICGHRDGCSTGCPGDSLYKLLPSIRIEASRIADSCGLILDIFQKFINYPQVIFPNPNQGNFRIHLDHTANNGILKVYQSDGKLILEQMINKDLDTNSNLSKGFYYYLFTDKKGQSIYGKFIVE